VRILGIDPGYALIGYGIIDILGNTIKTIEYGCIRTESNQDFFTRLLEINNQLKSILEAFSPNVLAIEKLYFARNTTTALDVSQVRGVIIAKSLERELEVYEYSPLEVKLAVTGYGRADKQQIQQMVKSLLNLSKIPKPDDVADALAVAICHTNSSKIKSLEKKYV
jgi:crossover junction endodeoxyribonuclease RuvC